MEQLARPPLVSTIKEKCRVCYTCVRECPAKAIRIRDGQAEVISERCIGCGNCFKVCSQNAKQILSSIPEVNSLLESGSKVAAIIAPSFPAEFTDVNYEQMVGMVRALGFDMVNEVAFGADLVADRYYKLLKQNPDGVYISTTCPAILEYIERYHPQLVKYLAPVVSPMIAAARALHRIYGDDLKIVFIGPCIAKKSEKDHKSVSGETDAVLTFIELHQMLDEKGIKPEKVAPSDFDKPHGGMGALFPVSRGILQAASISDDLLPGDIVATDGKSNFVEAIKEFESGALNVHLLEMLCCNGCIMGPGIQSDLPLFSRRSRVINYVRERLGIIDEEQWEKDMEMLADLDISRDFVAHDQRIPIPSKEELEKILNKMGKFSPQDELNCGACGFETCLEHAIAISQGLAESEMCLPYTIDKLRETVKDLAVSNEQLAEVQAALIQTEKMACMGQIGAAIAHEVNNPLGVVLMFAHLLLTEFDESSKHYNDIKMIAEQTTRCKKIVAGLLNFARQNKVSRQPTNLRDLVERSLKNVPTPSGVTVQIEHDDGVTVAELDPDQITQVLVNLFKNAYEAMPDGGTLTVRISCDDEHVRFTVADTGVGIPRENIPKVFEPFFTTKQLGKGTGLGLAVTYGIVKMHRGDIRVESNADPDAGPTGTTFTVILSRREQPD